MRANTLVVVKFISHEIDTPDYSTELLLHEIRVWHRLHHPHVLKLYGAIHLYKRNFVCEFASNGVLLDLLKKPGNENLKWQKLYEAALGLQYMHDHNVTHNNPKCDNIGHEQQGEADRLRTERSAELSEFQIAVGKIGAV